MYGLNNKTHLRTKEGVYLFVYKYLVTSETLDKDQSHIIKKKL